MNNNNNTNINTSSIGHVETIDNSTTSIVKPVAIKSTSPSNIVDNGSRGSSVDSTSPSLISSSHDLKSVSSKEELSGFQKIIPVSAIFNRSDDNPKDLISHSKLSAFMNWIPVDRSPEYLCQIFKNLRITNEASVVMKAAFVEKRAGSRPVSRPHNIAYITIAANSIIDSVQGNMFLEAISSEKYQVILDCGDEPALSNWQYRVYPTKKKLLPNEVPAHDLPQLGCITITMDEAVVTSERKSNTYEGHGGHGGNKGFLSDNLSDVSSIALSDSCANEVFNQTDNNNMKLSISQSGQKQYHQNNKTFANVARINSERSVIPTTKYEVAVPPPFPVIQGKRWADFSISDDDNNSHITHTSASAASVSAPAPAPAPAPSNEKEVSKTDTDTDTSLIDGNIKLTENIKDLYEKSVANVFSKQKICDESYANWQACNDVLTNAKAEQSRFQHLLDLVIGFKSHDGTVEDEMEEQELCVNTADVAHAYNNGTEPSTTVYDNNYVIDPHSGQVTPVLYYQPNVDGTFSPVLPTPSQNWYQLNSPSSYGPPQSQYNGQNNIGQHGQQNVSTPVATPKNAMRKIPDHTNDNSNHTRMTINEIATTPTTCVPESATMKSVSNNTKEEGDQDIGDTPVKDDSSPEEAREVIASTTTMQGLKEFIDMNNITSDQLKNLFQQLDSDEQV